MRVLLSFILLSAAFSFDAADEKSLPDGTDLKARAFESEGSSYSITNGNAYRFDPRSKRWIFFQHIYDPDFFQKNYIREGSNIYRIDPSSGKRYEMLKRFHSGFEDAADLRSLIGERTGWTSFVLQSPKAPSVADYVRLRHGILTGKTSFGENRVEPSAERFHSGKRSLRVFSVPPSPSMVCAKAHLETDLLHFGKGDDYWFSGWYFVESGMPYTIADIKTSWYESTPGLRVTLDDEEPQLELKWTDKPRYRQSARPGVKMPVGKWAHLKIHLKLSDQDDGFNELWLDDRKIVASPGRNLCTAEAIYNHLEVGITATSKNAVMFVDDIEVSDKPL